MCAYHSNAQARGLPQELTYSAGEIADAPLEGRVNEFFESPAPLLMGDFLLVRTSIHMRHACKAYIWGIHVRYICIFESPAPLLMGDFLLVRTSIHIRHTCTAYI